jgi:hypothetical protein
MVANIVHVLSRMRVKILRWIPRGQTSHRQVMLATRACADNISRTRIHMDFDRSTYGFYSYQVSLMFQQYNREER